MSPGKFARLMFKRETLSMMNCYHIKVVNLYQLPFKMSWNGRRNVLRFPTGAFCSIHTVPLEKRF